jgi:tetratricopeptide (TPR) repeat protein
MILELQVIVDKSLLEKRLEQIQTDQALLRKYTELQAREEVLLSRIKKLEAITGDDHSESTPTVNEVDEYRSAIQALPALGLNRKALALWGAGRFTNPEEALGLLDTALSLDPQNSLTINNRGVALYQLGRRQEALATFDQAIALAPDYSDAFSNRGVLYMAQQNYQAAEMEFTRVIELAPMRVDAYINRGVARKNLWKHHLALEDFKTALTIDPKATSPQSTHDSASLDFNELARICDKAQRACRLNLCRALEYLKTQDLCQ